MPLFDIPTFGKKKTPNTVTLPAKQISPLFIPEILENIFSFLSPHTLGINITLVCRLWYTHAQPLAPQKPTIWNLNDHRNEKDIKKMADALDMARTLNITLSQCNTLRMNKSAFTNMITLTSGNQVNLKHLSINEIAIPTPYEIEIALFLNSTGKALTTLHLKRVSHQYAPLEHILQLCPQLRTLVIDTVDDSRIHTYKTTSQIPQIPLPTTPPTTLPLQSLTLRHTKIDTRALLRSLLSCPILDELRLIQILGFHTLSSSETKFINNTTISSVFQRSFYTQIASSCPMLRKLHLSDYSMTRYEPQQPEQVDKLLDTFPLVTEWGLYAFMHNIYSLKRLKSFTRNTVTSIVITGDWTNHHDSQNNLHRYLCESPQVLHVIAPDFPFRFCMFDLEGILTRGRYIHDLNDRFKFQKHGYQIEEPYNRKIWACRNLKTLHLTFLYDGSVEPVNGELSRVLFGYLSRVCPRLENLAIDRVNLSASHYSGLCLLGRLKELRILKIVHGKLFAPRPSDFLWITKDSSPKLRRNMAILIAKFWYQEPSKLYARTPFHSNTGARVFPGCEPTPRFQDDHIIDGIDMANMGRGMDMVSYYQERLSNSLPCLPNLECISVNSKSTIDILKKYRPELRFILE